ncbi:MAG: hypothetical protein A2X35_09420 [Elusimicrobia bacterium GWA2_61_42]|nr:MAG: hypothetical protein A2X35_09420 [Elusimicrobia bacterium GWA2_61_42]OGR78306.1 MAG: hypothetical protein A2X38_00045 [Elusimicrobia bacterium GWC2_61_25]
MKFDLSSFLKVNRAAALPAALFSVLFTIAAPAFSAGAPDAADEREVFQITPEFSRTEKEIASQNPKYFTINPESVRLTLIETREEPNMNYVKLQEAPPKDLAGTVVMLGQIVNIASKVWQIVKDNIPVVNIESKYATAYPQGVTAASQLAQWSRPKTYVYGFYAENMYGSVMIDCKYKVTYSYNGAYKGKGKYLTAVAVIPEMAQVGWGYKFYMSASVPDSTIANVGTDADPIAAMQLKLNWRMATVLKVVDGTSVYYVEGNGFFEEIANPWKQTLKVENVKAAAPLLAETVF